MGKLVINDTIYEYKNFNTEIYNEAEKVFYLAIPKDKVKEVNKYFFISSFWIFIYCFAFIFDIFKQ